jgi:hypothetical protein
MAGIALVAVPPFDDDKAMLDCGYGSAIRLFAIETNASAYR